MQSGDYLEIVAQRVKRERLTRNITQAEMAHRIDISPRAYQNFEASGHISLDGLVKILFVFGRQNDLLNVLQIVVQDRSLDDFEKRMLPPRQRARKGKTA